jgi:hypothetical protein
MNKLTLTTIISFCVILTGTEPAWAYLDPGTGSLILQSLIAGIAGMLVVGRLYWAKLKNFLATAFSRSSSQPTTDGTADDERGNRDSELP